MDLGSYYSWHSMFAMVPLPPPKLANMTCRGPGTMLGTQWVCVLTGKRGAEDTPNVMKILLAKLPILPSEREPLSLSAWTECKQIFSAEGGRLSHPLMSQSAGEISSPFTLLLRK